MHTHDSLNFECPGTLKLRELKTRDRNTRVENAGPTMYLLVGLLAVQTLVLVIVVIV